MERAAASFVQHPRCPFCRDGVAPSQPKAACDACMTWHHAECWDEHGGCAACGGGAAVGAAPLDDEAAAPLDDEAAAPSSEAPVPPDEAAAPHAQAPPRQRLRRVGVLRPAGLRIQASERELRITHRWSSPLLLALAGPPFLLLALTLIAKALETPGPHLPLLGVLLLLAGVIYVLAAAAFNSTTIRATKGGLRIDHGPLPWPGGQALRTEQLEQLFCTEPQSDSHPASARLTAVLRGGRRVPLLQGSRQLVQFLELELETWLGIEDRRVRGEKS